MASVCTLKAKVAKFVDSGFVVILPLLRVMVFGRISHWVVDDE